MKKTPASSRTFLWLLIFCLVFSLLPGCGSGGSNGIGSLSGLSAGEGSLISPATKAGGPGSGFKLKYGWNLVKFPLPHARKFAFATMTWQGQTRLIKDAVAPG